MEVKILENKKDIVKFKVFGADHALMNLLREELAKSNGVEFATYSQPHPLLEGFVVTVKSKDAEKEINSALAAMKNVAKEFKAAVAKAK